jgi:hypothetical protein
MPHLHGMGTDMLGIDAKVQAKAALRDPYSEEGLNHPMVRRLVQEARADPATLTPALQRLQREAPDVAALVRTRQAGLLALLNGSGPLPAAHPPDPHSILGVEDLAARAAGAASTSKEAGRVRKEAAAAKDADGFTLPRGFALPSASATAPHDVLMEARVLEQLPAVAVYRRQKLLALAVATMRLDPSSAASSCGAGATFPERKRAWDIVNKWVFHSMRSGADACTSACPRDPLFPAPRLGKVGSGGEARKLSWLADQLFTAFGGERWAEREAWQARAEALAEEAGRLGAQVASPLLPGLPPSSPLLLLDLSILLSPLLLQYSSGRAVRGAPGWAVAAAAAGLGHA